jgi:hypothetical protein
MINLNDGKYLSPNITKEELINKYSEYDIFRNYIGDFELGQTYRSPLRRDDDVPSFNVFYSRRHHCLLFKDFAGKRGDCIRLVQEMLSLPSYQAAINQIAQDMSKATAFIPTPTSYSHTHEKLECDIKVKRRRWESRDLDYWNLYGISIPTLERFNVIPISAYYVGDVITNTFDIAYAYLEYKDSILTYKIYRPTVDKTKKWRNNNPYGVHAGYTQLPSMGDLLIITKSLKDVMCLYENMHTPAIAVQSETCFIKDTVVDEYRTRFKRVVTLFDNDRQGREQAESYKKLYDIEPIFVPTPYGAKDFSDLVKLAGKDNAVETIKILL